MKLTHHCTDIYGISHPNPDLATMRRVLQSLDDVESDEVAEVSLTHESGWTLVVHAHGIVTWEQWNKVGDLPLPFLREKNREAQLQLWMILAEGRTSVLQSLKWEF